MAQPVVHFEVHGKDGKKLQEFYGKLFDWNVDTSNPMGYGMVAGAEGGIGGGITESPAAPMVTFYVDVPDVAAALKKAESLGGKTVALGSSRAPHPLAPSPRLCTRGSGCGDV
jgi:uncharacterized protein